MAKFITAGYCSFPTLLAATLLTIGLGYFLLANPAETLGSFATSSHSAIAHIPIATAAAKDKISKIISVEKPQKLRPIDQERCVATKNDWCATWQTQDPIPVTPPPKGNKECLWNCNHGVGVCDAILGVCRCPAGWTGDSCEQRMRRPCSQWYRQRGFEPYDEPINWSQGGLTLRCAGECDDDIGMCFCNSTTKYGRRPNLNGPPNLPPQQFGRQMGHHCQPNQTPTGEPSAFGDVNNNDLYGEKGWCTADEPGYHCPCYLDGWLGPLCNIPAENFCPNQCSGHGECYLGWCKCHKGFFGHDCAYRMPGVQWDEGRYGTEKNRPWLKGHIETPAAEDPLPDATRLRPLIYVYELPPMYNQFMLMYRFSRDTCTHRLFGHENTTEWNDHWVYGIETGLHEMLLQSRHRTLDPGEADFFYIPVYSSCMFWPVLGANDFPFFHGGPGMTTRTSQGTNMWMEAFAYIRSHYPFWDRHGGRDHITLMTHDEGSCWLPAVLRNATVLTHWGRKDSPHKSGTAYDADLYSQEDIHPIYQPEGHVAKLGDYPCYNPEKDLVIPAFHSPRKYASSPLFGGNESKERKILGFFKGELRLYDKRMIYSRGIRQKLSALCEEKKWWTRHSIWINQTEPPEMSGVPYSSLLASSIFCFVLPGDGWSARMTDSILNGCIPVIIQDEVDLPFESILDFEKFALRIAQADMERVPEILLDVSAERVKEMQATLRKIWHRYHYTSYGPFKQLMSEMKERATANENAVDESGVKEENGRQVGEDDAFETIMGFLHSKLIKWEKEKAR